MLIIIYLVTAASYFLLYASGGTSILLATTFGFAAGCSAMCTVAHLVSRYK